LGVAWGEATCGEFGVGERSDYAAAGAVSELARQLANEASDGRVIISSHLYSEVEHAVEAESPREFTLRGFEEPVMVFGIRRLRPTLESRSGDGVDSRVHPERARGPDE
jgi:class 3 adenylate cyclase